MSTQLLLSLGQYQHSHPLRENNFPDLMSEETTEATYFDRRPNTRQNTDA